MLLLPSSAIGTIKQTRKVRLSEEESMTLWEKKKKTIRCFMLQFPSTEKGDEMMCSPGTVRDTTNQVGSGTTITREEGVLQPLSTLAPNTSFHSHRQRKDGASASSPL